MRKINLSEFERIGACEDGFKHFRAAFGDEVEVTEDNCRLMAGKLNFNFGAGLLLVGRQKEAYFAVVGPAAEVATRAMEASRALWDKDLDAASVGANKESYEQALRRALHARETREAPIRRGLEVLQAVEFAKAYNLEE